MVQKIALRHRPRSADRHRGRDESFFLRGEKKSLSRIKTASARFRISLSFLPYSPEQPLRVFIFQRAAPSDISRLFSSASDPQALPRHIGTEADAPRRVYPEFSARTLSALCRNRTTCQTTRKSRKVFSRTSKHIKQPPQCARTTVTQNGSESAESDPAFRDTGRRKTHISPAWKKSYQAEFAYFFIYGKHTFFRQRKTPDIPGGT